MRGRSRRQPSMLALLSIEDRIPPEHPLRPIKALADEALAKLDGQFDDMYEEGGRASVPPERLLKAVLLMALFSVRSERQLVEQIDYNMLFRWFLDMDLVEPVFNHSVFSKNRDRLLEEDIATSFLLAVVELARGRRLLSEEHFSVDGSLIQAWGSMKSFRPKGEDDGDNNGWNNFKGEKRSNKTHESKTDPDAKLMRKGRGQEAKLAHTMHAMMDNREGIITDFEVTEANGTCEREAAERMCRRLRKRRKGRVTLGADRGYDTKDFVGSLRALQVTPHVAQKKRYSAIDGRTTRHEGYRISISTRRRIEELFGWLKTVAGLRKSRFRGRPKTAWYATLSAAAYNLVRIARLEAA